MTASLHSIHGPTVSEGLAHKIISGREMVRQVMLSGDWFTIRLLQEKIRDIYGKNYSESCISARIRDQRKPEYGGYEIERKSTQVQGLYLYRMHTKENDNV